MSYECHVVTLKEILPHPDPEVHSLAITDIYGYTVIVGKNTQPGTTVLYFPVDGRLGLEFAEHNDLIRRKDENGNNAGGLFDLNRKVRSQKLRGVKSEGFCIPIESLEFTGGDWRALKHGDKFNEFNGFMICEKFVTVKGVQNAARQRFQDKKNAWFHKHTETEQFRFGVSTIKTGSLIHVTEKVHGTSARQGKVWDIPERKPLTFWQRFIPTLNKSARQPLVPTIVPMIGTRNVILGKTTGPGYYGDEGFRQTICKEWIDKLHDGEIVYGEIVGYLPSNASIMPAHDTSILKDKKFVKQYGKLMNYSYGCAPEHPVKPQMRFFVYRITQTSFDRADDEPVELSWFQVKRRCAELGLETVPEVTEPFLYDGNETELRSRIEVLTDGDSTLDPSHIREGVCVRAEEPSGRMKIFKSKSFTFGCLEGYLSEQMEEQGVQDIESAS